MNEGQSQLLAVSPSSSTKTLDASHELLELSIVFCGLLWEPMPAGQTRTHRLSESLLCHIVRAQRSASDEPDLQGTWWVQSPNKTNKLRCVILSVRRNTSTRLKPGNSVKLRIPHLGVS